MTKARTLADNFAADINGITAGTGITGGGTSGTVTITNEMATTITAKGDLLAGTGNAAFDNLAAGSDGDTLLADNSQSTGLRWGDNLGYTAGKNKIINGDFRINQRAFTSNTADGDYNFDRFAQLNSGGTVTVTPQVFTLGAAPVAGYEGTNFVRIVSASQSTSTNYAALIQRIESVRTFAGQTVTASFWAKASTGTPNIGVSFEQGFGTGGSPSSIVVTSITKQTISTSWVRYSFTTTLPSIAGKTLGTNFDGNLNLLIFTSCGTGVTGYSTDVGLQNITAEIWGVQVEAGSVATAFQTATGTLQGELAACQRYYWRNDSATASTNYHTFASGFNSSTSRLYGLTTFPTIMRIAPTATYLAAANYNTYVANALTAVSGFTLDTANVNNITVGFNVATTPFTAGQGGTVVAANNKTAYIEYSAEL